MCYVDIFLFGSNSRIDARTIRLNEGTISFIMKLDSRILLYRQLIAEQELQIIQFSNFVQIFFIFILLFYSTVSKLS